MGIWWTFVLRTEYYLVDEVFLNSAHVARGTVCFDDKIIYISVHNVGLRNPVYNAETWRRNHRICLSEFGNQFTSTPWWFQGKQYAPSYKIYFDLWILAERDSNKRTIVKEKKKIVSNNRRIRQKGKITRCACSRFVRFLRSATPPETLSCTRWQIGRSRCFR